MASAKFRSVGGSIMVAVPRHMVEQLKLAPMSERAPNLIVNEVIDVLMDLLG